MHTNVAQKREERFSRLCQMASQIAAGLVKGMPTITEEQKQFYAKTAFDIANYIEQHARTRCPQGHL